MTRFNSIVVATMVARVLSSNAFGSDGWTDFVADLQHNQKIVYVSEVGGTNPGTVYFWDGANPPSDIGSNPFEPSGTVQPFETITAAYDALVDGEPGWILLRKGESWDEEWKTQFLHPLQLKSGPSSGNGWMLIGAYSDGGSSDARPTVNQISASQGVDPLHSLAIVGIKVLGENDTAIRIIPPGSTRLHIEDVLVPVGERHGINIAHVEDVRIRRSVVHGRYHPSGGDTSGLLMGNNHGVLIEECVFWHNGWHPDHDPEECADENGDHWGCPTQFNHNAYIASSNTNVTLMRNISADASSHGYQQRRGGLHENNLSLRNPIGLLWGGTGSDDPWPETFGHGSVRHNVYIDGRDIDSSTKRGWGIRIQRVGVFEHMDGPHPTHVHGNLIAHQRTGHSGFAFPLRQALLDLDIAYNVVYDWSHPTECVIGLSTLCHATPQVNVSIRNNDFQQVNNGEIIHHSAGFAEFHFSGNQYYATPTNQACAFRIPVNPCAAVGCTSGGGTCHDFSSWVTESGETGATFGQQTYTDPSRDMKSYMEFLGYCYCEDCIDCTTVCNDPEKVFCDGITAFMLEAIQQSKTNWREEFTAARVNCYMREGFDMHEPCPGELTGDGNVGVPDLVELLNQWGDCAVCSPAACTADLTGDCKVGVPDLIVLLTHWGPCPVGCGGEPATLDPCFEYCVDNYLGTNDFERCIEWCDEGALGEFVPEGDGDETA